ncbi:MAG: hypothetical protein HYR55_00850 [Acidobacteria bacterium]|nr:hypothetical protein [Acidobacteriota bacterium]MBI3656057.1 hypothetical protein [Acidobacteriota bacterium]
MQTYNKLIIGAVLVGQLIGVLYLFPPRDWLSREPIYTGDYPAHYSRCLATAEFLAKTGQVDGYDPYLKSGYVISPFLGDGARIMQILTWFFPMAMKVLVFKLYVIAVFLFMPLILYHTARNFGMAEREITILLTAGFVLWWIPAFPYHLAIFGLATFVLASYLILYFASFLYRLTTQGGLRPLVALVALAPLAVMVHMESVILVFPLFVIAAVFLGPSKRMFLFLLCAVIAIVVNGFWLAPYLREALPYFLNSAFAAAHPSPDDPTAIVHLTEMNLLKNVRTFFTGVALPMAVMAILGFYQLMRQDGKIKFIFFLVPTIFYAFLNYFGSFLPGVVVLQPLRFKLPMLLFLLVPTVIGVNLLYEKATSRSEKLKWALMPSLLLLVCIGTVCAIPVARPRDDFSARLSEHGNNLLDWIRRNTNKKARILLEGDDLSIHLRNPKYYGGHFPALIPRLVNREFISTTFPVLDFPGFSDGILFTKEIQKYGLPDFKRYFELYNIKWIICWSDAAATTLSAFPEYITLVNKIDTLFIFEVARLSSFFSQGDGEVAADYSRLHLSNLRAENGSIIIKYHWAEQLRTTPERAINPIYLDADPQGFIQILDPPESLTIRYAP